jgi:hypothetical protein
MGDENSTFQEHQSQIYCALQIHEQSSTFNFLVKVFKFDMEHFWNGSTQLRLSTEGLSYMSSNIFRRKRESYQPYLGYLGENIVCYEPFCF